MAIFAAIHIILLIHVDGHQHAAEVVAQFVIHQHFYILLQVLEQLPEVLMADGAHFP